MVVDCFYMHCCLQSLAQATADATDNLAAFQAERQQRQEELALLRAQLAQLQALGASKEREAAAAAAKAEGECCPGGCDGDSMGVAHGHWCAGAPQLLCHQCLVRTPPAMFALLAHLQI